MDKNQWEASVRRCRAPARRRTLLASAAGCVALGGVLSLLPGGRAGMPPPAPGPGRQAMNAVTDGRPAALPDLAALIGAREAQVRAQPRDARAWAVLGAAYVEQGQRAADAAYYPRAEEALRRSLTVRTGRHARTADTLTALDGLAALAVARRDFSEARKWGESARELDPARWTTRGLLIDAYTGLGDRKEARRQLGRLLELRTDPAVRARTAAVYWDRGWREDAQAQLADAAAGARSPAERAAYLERAGQLAWERGEREEALRHFQEAVRTDADQRAAQAGQGRALAALGRTSEALAAYRMAYAKQPCPRYALELGELYESLGLGQAARVQYDLVRTGVREAAEGGADEGLVLGQLEADHGNPRTAVRRLRAEWQRQPGIAVTDALGWALHRAGRHKEALSFARTATDDSHGGGVRSAPYVYHRGMIERALGMDGSARRHLEEALRINPYFSPLRAPAARAALAELGEPSLKDAPEPGG